MLIVLRIMAALFDDITRIVCYLIGGLFVIFIGGVIFRLVWDLMLIGWNFP